MNNIQSTKTGVIYTQNDIHELKLNLEQCAKKHNSASNLMQCYHIAIQKFENIIDNKKSQQSTIQPTTTTLESNKLPSTCSDSSQYFDPIEYHSRYDEDHDPYYDDNHNIR
jgi:hypothetical protein